MGRVSRSPRRSFDAPCASVPRGLPASNTLITEYCKMCPLAHFERRLDVPGTSGAGAFRPPVHFLENLILNKTRQRIDKIYRCSSLCIRKDLVVLRNPPRSAWYPLGQRTSHRPISNGQLHALRHFHLRPIYPVLSGGPPGIASVDISS